MTNGSVTTTYTYDKNNRLTGSSKTGEVIEYTYDNNGNQTEVETNGVVTETLTYDKLNRQTSSNSTTYNYRADGLRNSKTVSGVTTTHVWSGNNIWADLTSGGSRVYIWGINLIYNVSGSTRTFYMYNAHGDVVHLTSSTGSKSKDYDYDAFGNERNIDYNDTNLYRYCGEYFDNETGNIYLRARFYDPSIGRFISQDTITAQFIEMPNEQKLPDPLSLNLYTYCANNPILYQDASGHVFMLVTAAIGAVVGGIVGGVVSYATTGKVTWQSVAGGAALGAVAGLTMGAATSLYLTAGTIGGATALASTSTVVGITTGSTMVGGSIVAIGGAAASGAGVIATGQWHHVLSNPIMNVINKHPTLRGLFDRAGSLVQALTKEAHKGYQTWHRAIDNTMVQWLNNNPNATMKQFWQQMYKLYNTPDMINRFGNGVINYIKEMIK